MSDIVRYKSYLPFCLLCGNKNVQHDISPNGWNAWCGCEPTNFSRSKPSIYHKLGFRLTTYQRGRDGDNINPLYAIWGKRRSYKLFEEKDGKFVRVMPPRKTRNKKSDG